MPKSVASQESQSTLPDSLPPFSDDGSIRSAASSHSTFSNTSAYWANPPDTHLPTGYPSYDQKDMFGTGAPGSSSGPQRSSTIKASNQASFSNSGASLSKSPAPAPERPSIPCSSAMADSSDDSTSGAVLASSSASPPVLHSLVFPNAGTGYTADKSSGSSDRRFKEACLALDEAAPRLSMSSTGSGSTSELATPENLHQSWPYDDVDASTVASSAMEHKDAQSGNPKSHIPPSTATAADVDRRPPSRELDASSASLDRLAIQRPAKLERLSSAATNVTARGSTRSDESPQTATQSPRSSQVPDLSSLRMSSGADSPSFFSRTPAPNDLLTYCITSPRLDADLPNRASMTSPDSWRSLLPEHDPYFASDGQLRASQHQRSASPHSLHPSTGAFDIDAYVSDKTSPRVSANERMSGSSFDTARTSFSSAISGYSTMSMAGLSRPSMQSQDSARSDSWRSLLPDDDRYHASRDGVSGARRLELSPSLTSPSLSDHLDSPVSFDGQNHRSAFSALQAPRTLSPASSEAETAARRHSSFSSVEPNNSTQYAATRNMLAAMRDTARSLGSSLSSSGNFLTVSRGNDLLDAPSMTPALSSSTADDSSERESWPTSRGGRCGYGANSPLSTGPITPETGPTPHGKSSLVAVLDQEPGSLARVDSPAHVSETSDSIVQATQDGLLTTTTTTTTKITTTTTTQVLPDAPVKTRSDAGADDFLPFAEEGDEGLQSQPMKARGSSCSVSTPISPPSLPFLERRPAPPETDLVIETERSKYTLITRLPGFSLDCITLATKQHAHHRTLHIVADKWDAEGGGHFERRVTFPDKECDLKNVKAEFDGTTLRVYVPRKSAPNRFSSASSATF